MMNTSSVGFALIPPHPGLVQNDNMIFKAQSGNVVFRRWTRVVSNGRSVTDRWTMGEIIKFGAFRMADQLSVAVLAVHFDISIGRKLFHSFSKRVDVPVTAVNDTRLRYLSLSSDPRPEV